MAKRLHLIFLALEDEFIVCQSTVEPRYLELAYFELLLISKWKSGPCFNMKQQVTK